MVRLKIAKMFNKRPRIIYKENINGEVEKTWASLEKASKALNYEPRVQIDEGLKKYVQWIENSNINQLIIH